MENENKSKQEEELFNEVVKQMNTIYAEAMDKQIKIVADEIVKLRNRLLLRLALKTAFGTLGIVVVIILFKNFS